MSLQRPSLPLHDSSANLSQTAESEGCSNQKRYHQSLL
jgi:hypothetical protein